MTKYVLHSGKSEEKSSKDRAFYQEILRGYASPIRILFLYFAQDESAWPDLFLRHQQKFRLAARSCQIEFSIAVKELTVLKRQIQAANIIYICGGITGGLKYYLRDITEDLPRLWEGKTVVGSSAGVHVLSRYYYNRKEHTVSTGLGIIPIKAFCHFTPGHKTALRCLQLYGEDLETVVLRENQFAILNAGPSARLTVSMYSSCIDSKDGSHSKPLESSCS